MIRDAMEVMKSLWLRMNNPPEIQGLLSQIDRQTESARCLRREAQDVSDNGDAAIIKIAQEMGRK